jgi:hypothetical protein
MVNRRLLIRSGLFLFIILSIISNAAAIKVDQVPNLAPKLDEGTPVNFTLKIYDLDQRTVDDLTIETNLVASGNSPIFDFGDLNKYIETERYKQTLHLNLSSIPNKKTITIMVSGKTPSGEISDSVRNNLVLTTFNDGDLKYYEVKNGEENPLGIAAFKLNIQKKEQFEDTMQKINLDELNPLKQDVRDLFNIGFVTEAQKMASEMSEIRLPPSNLKLFYIVDVNSDFSLNLITVIFLLLGCVVGFVIRMKTSELKEED